MKITRSLLALALLLAFTFQAEAKKIQLKYQLKAGDQFAYSLTTTQEIAQEVMGQSQTTNMGTSFAYDFKVLSILPDGNFRLECKLIEYSLNTTTPMGDMKYNSATDKEVPDYAKATSLTMNEVFVFTLSPLGKISDVQAPEGLAEKIKSAAGGGDQMEEQMMAGASAGAGTADAFVKSIKDLFVIFPENAVGPKSTWSTEDKMQVEQMIAFNTKTDFTLNKTSKEDNEIGVSSVITMGESKGMEMQGMTMNFEMAGGALGTFSTNALSGLLLTGEDTTTISGVVSIESPQLPAPMSIPMSIKAVKKIARK